ncbi:MAG: sigma 54-interacting transcriptional regulator, partial [Acidobacteriota bacterium]
MPGKTILFVAQAHTITPLFGHFKDAGMEAGIADTLSGALAFIRKSRPCLVFSQAKIGGAYNAAALLAAGRDADDFPPVIVFSDRGTAQEAQAFMEQGARDYWLEPLLWEKILAVLPGVEACVDDAADAAVQAQAPLAAAAAMSQVQQGMPQPASPEPAPPVPPRPASPGVVGERFAIIGGHPAVLRVLALARQVARSKATVLISGESGTGKEMFARFLHAHSDRAGKPFVALNCAALPENLLESELFGHEKGAFTGAIAKKLGKFELAAGGTILLDEISEMELALQAKLLRVLQEGEFDRVGGTETVRVDVRVLATTNRRLEQYVEEGKFRQD